MNQKRDQATKNIINLLLNASDYEQISIIRENQELIDSEFVNTMIEVAEVLAKQGKPKASLWLYWFNWLSYAIAVTLLAGAGFGQLYANQPIFGANGPSDYFS